MDCKLRRPCASSSVLQSLSAHASTTNPTLAPFSPSQNWIRTSRSRCCATRLWPNCEERGRPVLTHGRCRRYWNCRALVRGGCRSRRDDSRLAGQQATKQAVQGTVNAINNISQSHEKSDAPAVPVVTEQCKEKEKEDDPCKDLKEQIEEVIDELRTRWYQYQEDEGGPFQTPSRSLPIPGTDSVRAPGRGNSTKTSSSD